MADQNSKKSLRMKLLTSGAVLGGLLLVGIAVKKLRAATAVDSSLSGAPVA